MKAWNLHDVGDIRYEEVTTPQLADQNVLVKVMAAGICGSDIPRIYRDGSHKMPLIIGHEFAGQVVQVGDGVDKSWVDARVGIFPLIPCKECNPCRQKKYEMCRHYSYLGSRENGGFAEYVAVPVWNLISLPKTVSYEAAAMLEPMAVAVHAMRQVNILADDTIFVCGLGTIGMLLTMFLHELGLKNIFIIGNKQFQKETIVKLGIEESHFCDITMENVDEWISTCTNGNGADVFFECVGKDSTLSQAIDNTAPGGKVCLVGNPYSNMELPKAVYWKILRNQLQIVGTWNSSFTHTAEDDWHYVLKLLEEKKINPELLISHRLQSEDLRKGFEIMRDKKEDYLKIMVTRNPA